MPLFSCRVNCLVDFTPDEWEVSFKSVKKRVSYLISADDTKVLLEVWDLVIDLSYPVIITSSCNYYSRSNIDESIRKKLSDLLILFIEFIIELNMPSLYLLSSDFILISKDPTQLRMKSKLYSLFSHYMVEYLDSQSE